jgi:hypothetical protein
MTKNDWIHTFINENGEVTKRLFTEEETADLLKQQAAQKDYLASINKAEADKVIAKQSAQAKLAALGLTEEEVASILG